MLPRVNLLIALLWLPLIAGCDGCRRDSQQAAKEKEAPSEEFSSRPALAFPSDGGPSIGIKPGHWITASQSLKNNLIDARGQLVTESSAAGTQAQDIDPLLARSGIASMRPAVLPKGQMRRFDYRILTALPSGNDQKRGFLSSRFVSSGGTVYEGSMQQPVSLLLPEEFFFVILSERPERFARFQVSDWIRPVRDELDFMQSGGNYRLVIPPTKDVIPLAETMLDWSSTAYLFWDDVSPDVLTPQQQMAIADWVHFGGQLIVNGADATDSLAKTALAELLPLAPAGNVELDAEAASNLLRSWAVSSDRSTEKQIALLRSQSGRVAVDGEVSADANIIQGSDGLLLSRSIGRGRVIQSRFDLTSDWLVNWQSYDSFVNSVLLSRPRRELQDSVNASEDSLLGQNYPDYNVSQADPAFNTRFRLAARDAVLGSSESAGSDAGANRSDAGANRSDPSVKRIDPWTANQSFSGISGWNDESDVIGLSRQILRSESGIEIPSSSLVIRSLGYYLLILIPVNYLVFRLLGRLEYAWLAVPLIALVGAIWVARAARLDIGFARSQTEIGFLELQPGYSRGHLSRVIAIYNSLSSRYDIAFKTIDAAAAPISGALESQDGSKVYFKTGFAEGPILSGLPVISNQIRMIHAEQVIDLGGSIELDESGQLVNRTTMELDEAMVVESNERGQVRIAVVGPLGAGVTSSLRFRPLDEVNLPRDLPMQTSRMLQAWISPDSMPTGSIRMLARYDGSLEGSNITPATQQTAAQTIVLAHLKHPAWPEPKSDVNLIADLRPVLSDKTDGDKTDGDKTDTSELDEAENP
jgi:hypothetical protein